MKRLSILVICSCFYSIGLTSSTFSINRLVTFYDTFLAEEKEELYRAHLTTSSSITPTPTPTPPPAPEPAPPLEGYAPILIVNNSGLEPDRLYFLGTGSSLSGDQHFLAPNLSTGVCSYVLPNAGNSADSNISVKLSELPTSGVNTFLIYIPQQISGRCYLSVDDPLYLKTTNTTISAPSITSPRDPSYYTLYQNFELTLDADYNLYANVSNVDFYSLPMGLTSNTYPSGDLYPTLDNLTASGFSQETGRQSILTTVDAGLSSGDNSSPKQWYNLTIPYYDNPYTNSGSTTDLRILAAKNSIGFATGVFKSAQTPQGAFNSTYLQDSTSGPTSGNTFMEDLASFYNAPNTTTFIVYPGTPTTATYSMTFKAAAPTVLSLTTASPGAFNVDIDLSNLTTVDLLGGDVGAWDADDVFDPALDSSNRGCYTEIAKLLSALFSIGQLPPTDGTLTQPIESRTSYFDTYRGDYFSNPSGFTDHGPWYNLFDELMHPLMVKTDNYGLGYAYDYDDLIGLGGEMHVLIGNGGTQNTDYPYYQLLVAPINTTIPTPKSSFGPYSVTLTPIDAGKTPINIIYTTSSGGTPSTTQAVPQGTGTSVQINNVYDYFQVQYPELGLTYNVYPKHQLIQSVSNRYSDADSIPMNGIAFDTVSGTGSSFTMSFPNIP